MAWGDTAAPVGSGPVRPLPAKPQETGGTAARLRSALAAGAPTVGMVPPETAIMNPSQYAPVTGGVYGAESAMPARLLAFPQVVDASARSADVAVTLPVAALTMFTKPCLPPVLAVPVTHMLILVTGTPATSGTSR